MQARDDDDDDDDDNNGRVENEVSSSSSLGGEGNARWCNMFIKNIDQKGEINLDKRRDRGPYCEKVEGKGRKEGAFFASRPPSLQEKKP